MNSFIRCHHDVMYKDECKQCEIVWCKEVISSCEITLKKFKNKLKKLEKDS